MHKVLLSTLTFNLELMNFIFVKDLHGEIKSTQAHFTCLLSEVVDSLGDLNILASGFETFGYF